MDIQRQQNGAKDLKDLVLPEVTPGDLLNAFIGAIDASKDREKKETMQKVFAILDELRGKDGCVAVDCVKRVLKLRGLA